VSEHGPGCSRLGRPTLPLVGPALRPVSAGIYPRIPRGPVRDIEAPEWLKEQEYEQRRRETMRYWFMLVVAIVAAIAAVIAAWPIVKEWLLRL
jgi:hypothetical protein